ncbi:TonB family protein [Rufibacter quisquiliarum]
MSMCKIIYLSLLLLLPPCLLKAQTPSDYKKDLNQHRAHQDSVFQYDEKSPLAPEAKATFKGLAYFPIDEAYRVKAKFVPTPQEGIFQMPTTTDHLPNYKKYGELHFQLQGQPLKLNVYQNQELIKQPKYHTYLFIPFTDATTGQETYATGRYLDFSIPHSQDSVWLDFNKAYNPYCAYGDGYSCPIPPKENRLPVRIEAGVKTYEKQKLEAAGGMQMQESIAEFPGGLAALLKFMNSQFVMPPLARKAGVNGTVEFSFVVNQDGSLDEFQITKPLRADVDVAVLHAARQMPKWKPAMQNGKPVRFKYTMPFRIK